MRIFVYILLILFAGVTFGQDNERANIDVSGSRRNFLKK